MCAGADVHGVVVVCCLRCRDGWVVQVAQDTACRALGWIVTGNEEIRGDLKSQSEEAEDAVAGLCAERCEVPDLCFVGGEGWREGLLGFALGVKFAEVECSARFIWLIFSFLFTVCL